ncbi:MAG: hypothetical protein KAR35_06310 [Candidatus Heimdallarchaeota archaeon]|nr:hypothetical protein [Candidatus Heimdallarchaeota archaeon]MCK5048972.1 hypothetical protein [Candidatus Heimdallarchaeota archaeon]
MVGFGQQGPVPADKLITLNLVQLITSLYTGDIESANIFLSSLKEDYARYISQMNPTLKRLVREILQSIDMYKPSDVSTPTHAATQVQPSQTDQSQAAQPEAQPEAQAEAQADSSWMGAWGKSKTDSSTESGAGEGSFTSELSQAVGDVRDKKRTKTKTSLRGSLDDLDDI